MSRDDGLSRLTRSLLLGVSLGTVGLTQVGCAAIEVEQMVSGMDRGAALTVREANLCSTALRSRAAADVEALMSAYPASRCLPPLLRAMPASTIAALSPEVVAGLDPSVLRALPPDLLARLPGARRVAAAATAAPPVRASGSEGGQY
jgi:hypothetical protein